MEYNRNTLLPSKPFTLKLSLFISTIVAVINKKISKPSINLNYSQLNFFIFLLTDELICKMIYMYKVTLISCVGEKKTLFLIQPTY